MHDMPRGGAREGAGRKPLPENKRRSNLNVKVMPATKGVIKGLAKQAKTSQGKLVDWFCLAEAAAPARAAGVAQARAFKPGEKQR